MTAQAPSEATLSIVIPFREAELTLRPLIAALLPQVRDVPGVEVIAVDDGSRGRGAEWVEEAGFRLIRRGRSHGPGAARNLGAREATREILLFLDADVIPGADLIAHVRKRFTDPDLVALSGVYHIDPANEGFYAGYKALRCHAWFQGKTSFGSLETACAAIRRESFLGAGGFNESFEGADVEDYELGYRLAGAKGIPLDHDMRVKHHFPGAARDLRNLARRSFLWARLPRPAVFDAVATTPAEGAAALATYGMTAALAAAVLTGVQTFGYLAMALAATHLILRRAFYLLCHNEMGSRFTVAAAFTAMAGDLVVVPSVAAGTLARWTTAGRPRALDGAQG